MREEGACSSFRASAAPFLVIPSELPSVIPSERSESRNLIQAARLRFLAALGMTMGCRHSERAERVEESQSLSPALVTAFTRMHADEKPRMHADRRVRSSLISRFLDLLFLRVRPRFLIRVCPRSRCSFGTRTESPRCARNDSSLSFRASAASRGISSAVRTSGLRSV